MTAVCATEKDRLRYMGGLLKDPKEVLVWRIYFPFGFTFSAMLPFILPTV